VGGVDSISSGYGPVVGCCERGDEHSGSGATGLVCRPILSYNIFQLSLVVD
jgi:hypothetical protein